LQPKKITTAQEGVKKSLNVRFHYKRQVTLIDYTVVALSICPHLLSNRAHMNVNYNIVDLLPNKSQLLCCFLKQKICTKTRYV
jgi:hypothetical protein